MVSKVAVSPWSVELYHYDHLLQVFDNPQPVDIEKIGPELKLTFKLLIDLDVNPNEITHIGYYMWGQRFARVRQLAINYDNTIERGWTNVWYIARLQITEIDGATFP